MSQDELNDLATSAKGPFALAGPIARPDPRKVPLRGDLAHVGLAGKHFVPHYAVPQPRGVLPGGARLLAEPSETAEELCVLLEGDSFEVLDLSREWAWGCLSLEGPVGYVHLDHLEPVVA
ncbi:hypothetical protein [Aurantiacibacter gilvus]|uniref:Bacterial dipeptidyl-peptidase SH3 domain-containing protein n=1 Tax=Aurantiacibacter gilvus TaxID=3139141 RepID=A0ABU9IAQ3_9SPHN